MVLSTTRSAAVQLEVQRGGQKLSVKVVPVREEVRSQESAIIYGWLLTPILVSTEEPLDDSSVLVLVPAFGERLSALRGGGLLDCDGAIDDFPRTASL